MHDKDFNSHLDRPVFSRVACFFISVETVSRYDRLVVDRFSLWFISAVRTSGDDEFLFFSLFCFVCLVKTKKVLLHVKPFRVTYLNKLKTPTFKPNILKK